MHQGSNGSKWIFIGSEHKDYDDSMKEWIKILSAAFPTSEGRIDFQYESVGKDADDPWDRSGFYLISKGKIIGTVPCWCNER